MPPEKARHVAKLLMALMKYCDYEVLARLPQQGETVYLSIEGRPFVTMSEVEEELPFILVHGGTPHSTREKRVWAAEQKRIIGEGYKLFHSPKLGTNGISCDMCHPNASNIHPETYPKFQTQLKTVALLRDMVNWCIENPMEGCIENPMEGGKLADGDHKMKALEAYMLSARAGKTLAPGKH
jgi:thiosulfate dehydrogenase